MTREQIEARFEETFPVLAHNRPSLVMPLRRDEVLEWIVKLAAELQAPPTGEAVEKAWRDFGEAVDAWITCDTAQLAEVQRRVDDAVRAYGAACRASGRAEAMAETTMKGAK